MDILAKYGAAERAVFREVVIELVLSTDISDKYLKSKYFHKLHDLSERELQLVGCRVRWSGVKWGEVG
jgi:hypothetical protein